MTGGEISKRDREAIKNVKLILSEEEVSSPYRTFVSPYRKSMTYILRSVARNGHLNDAQAIYLEKVYKASQKVKTLNENFDGEFRNSAVALLEEIIEFSKPYAKGDRSLTSRRSQTRFRARQMRNGEYFWDAHTYSANSLLTALRDKGVDVRNLEQRLTELAQRTSIDSEQ